MCCWLNPQLHAPHASHAPHAQAAQWVNEDHVLMAAHPRGLVLHARDKALESEHVTRVARAERAEAEEGRGGR